MNLCYSLTNITKILIYARFKKHIDREKIHENSKNNEEKLLKLLKIKISAAQN